MDIALAIDAIVPSAKYGGSVTDNTREAFDALRWEDSRPQPTWAELEAVVIPVAAPGTITRRQARLALLQAGKLAAVESAIANIADPAQKMAAQIEYEAETWKRANPWIERTGQAVGLTPEQIDALFIAAATL